MINLSFSRLFQDRAKIQVKRRPPTRQARRAAAATSSASDTTLFGTTTNEDASARVSWGGFPTQEGLEKSEVDSGQRPSRTDTKDSDMSDEFFGFTSSASSKVTENEEVEDPLKGGLFSASASKPKVSKTNELFSDDSDLFEVSSEKAKKKEPATDKTPSAAVQDDIFSVVKAKEESKTSAAEPLVGKDTDEGLFTTDSSRDDILSSVSDKKVEKKLEPSSEKKPSKAVASKITSPLDNDILFSSVQKDDKNAATAAKAADKTEPKLPAKEKAPALDEDLVASSSAKKESKPEKKESEKVTSDKPKFTSPLGDDDDLFTVSAPVKKEIKSVADSAAKKTASPQTSKKTTAKSSSVLDVSILSSLLMIVHFLHRKDRFITMCYCDSQVISYVCLIVLVSGKSKKLLVNKSSAR